MPCADARGRHSFWYIYSFHDAIYSFQLLCNPHRSSICFFANSWKKMSQAARNTGKVRAFRCADVLSQMLTIYHQSLVTRDCPKLPAIVISMSRSASLQLGGAAASQPGSPIYLAWSGRTSTLASPMPSFAEKDNPADLTNTVYPLSSHDSVIGGLGDVSKAIWKKGNKCYLVSDLAIVDNNIPTESQHKGGGQTYQTTKQHPRPKRQDGEGAFPPLYGTHGV